jgi:hypothetical protein
VGQSDAGRSLKAAPKPPPSPPKPPRPPSPATRSRRSLLSAASRNGYCAHFFSFAAGVTVADVGAAPYDDAAAAWTVSFADAATGAPTERALSLSGGVTAGQYPVIIPSASTAAGALTVSVTASHTGDAGWRTLFDFDGLVFSIYAGLVNVAAPGSEPLWVRDFISISNHNGASSSCSAGMYLTSTESDVGSWPADTTATITLTVDENGEIGVPTVNDLPLELVVFPPNADWVPACRPVAFHTSSRLLVGAGGDMGADTKFKGVIASVGLDTVLLRPFVCAGWNDPIQCNALGALYVSTMGSSWSQNDGWADAALGTATDYCTFDGVTCDDGVIATLCVPCDKRVVPW